MIMELPRSFNSAFAKIVDGILYIYKGVSCEKVMCSLTYSCKKKRCVYCGIKVGRRKNSTLDHRYPRDTGGVSITNNLFPCCPKYNSQKSNLTHEEYLIWRDLPKLEAKEFIAESRRKKEVILREIGFKLPEEWITYMKCEEIICYDDGSYTLGKKYQKVQEFYEKYQNLPRPVVVDKYGQILDGYNIILFARTKNIEYVPTIRLENVVCFTS